MQAPYGSWKSPITAEIVSGKDRVLTANVQADGDTVYFVESRPDEGGRMVLMARSSDGKVHEVLPPEYNVRTRYLEYGGLGFHAHKGSVYFVNFADQDIYIARADSEIRRLTQAKGNRFADFTVDEKRGRLIALREQPAKPESRNTVCAIDLQTGAVTDLVHGADFYLSPRVQGDRLLWIEWKHPNMAWNGTELWTAPVEDVAAKNKVAGSKTEAVSQARWADDGEIYFMAELTNYLNLYRYKNGKVENVFPRDNEFALPDWVPGTQQHAIGGDGKVWAACMVGGRWQILRGVPGQPPELIGEPVTNVGVIQPYRDGILCVVNGAVGPAAILYLSGEGRKEILFTPSVSPIDPAYVSQAEEIRYAIEDGGLGYAWYYPPKNPQYTAREWEKPPLVVMAHGGPTVFSPASFRKEIQFWTSRGYAVVDVNYGGSTGNGRAYRERLRGMWGVVDVADCVAAVQHLSAQGKIDPKRVAIRGGSAGGYTTLAALAFTKDVFAVGASYYGVSELELLAKETHKLESRYLDQLVGPYPEAIALYKERSPSEHIEGFSCPMIFFQGGEDKVVPPNQSELMYEALKRKGITTEYHLYPSEGHGFRAAASNQHSLRAEHNFYARVFGFETQPEDRNV